MSRIPIAAHFAVPSVQCTTSKCVTDSSKEVRTARASGSTTAFSAFTPANSRTASIDSQSVSTTSSIVPSTARRHCPCHITRESPEKCDFEKSENLLAVHTRRRAAVASSKVPRIARGECHTRAPYLSCPPAFARGKGRFRNRRRLSGPNAFAKDLV